MYISCHLSIWHYIYTHTVCKMHVCATHSYNTIVNILGTVYSVNIVG